METSEGLKRVRLLGMCLEDLKRIVDELDMPAYTARQIARWLYGKHILTIEDMTNLSKRHRAALGVLYEVGCRRAISSEVSTDGTVKYLFPTERGLFVETVYIPDGNRGTLCVSTQVGCRMGCYFCQTGKQRFQGNLSVGDIINQVYSLPQREFLTNIVFMGQGEPFDNLENVLKAIEILTAEWGYGWSPKRITVSTVGLRVGLRRFLNECECHLAVSLHSPISHQRRQLMPAEGAMPIADTIALLREYDFSHQRRLSFEYIVFKGVNDSMLHARGLTKLLRGLDCRINLIRFHKIPDVDLESPDEKQMEAFREYLTNHGLFTTIRADRGQDIDAACGMLTTLKENEGLS